MIILSLAKTDFTGAHYHGKSYHKRLKYFDPRFINWHQFQFNILFFNNVNKRYLLKKMGQPKNAATIYAKNLEYLSVLLHMAAILGASRKLPQNIEKILQKSLLYYSLIAIQDLTKPIDFSASIFASGNKVIISCFLSK